MRIVLIALGIVLLFFGILFYNIGSAEVEKRESYGVLDDAAEELSDDYREEKSSYQLMKVFGLFFGLVGFVLLIAGFVIPAKAKNKISNNKRFDLPVIGNAMNDYIERNKGDISENKESQALDVLKLRYAKGEITKEEYDKIKKDIEE